MSSLISAERVGRCFMYLWIRYVKRENIAYPEVDIRFSHWIFLLIGLGVFGIIVGGTLLCFYLAR